MATNLSGNERKLYASIFLDLDSDGNGWLSREELREGLRRLGFRMTNVEAEKMFRELDENEDGRITLDEFLGLLGRIKKKAPR